MELTDIAAMFGLADYLVTVCGVAAILAAFAPPATEASHAWWKHCRTVLDLLAANWRNARNRRA